MWSNVVEETGDGRPDLNPYRRGKKHPVLSTTLGKVPKVRVSVSTIFIDILSSPSYEPPHEKTNNLGFRPGRI